LSTRRSPVKRSLQLYLQGHHAGARAAVATVRSQASKARGSELGELLARLVDEIDEDRHTLQVAMARLGLRPSATRDLAARVTAWVGRRLLHLHLPGPPQARLIGLESLSLGIEGKIRLWSTLRALAPDDPRLGADPRLGEIDYDALIERAEQQRRAIEHHRLEAAREADANIEIADRGPTVELPAVEDVEDSEDVGEAGVLSAAGHTDAAGDARVPAAADGADAQPVSAAGDAGDTVAVPAVEAAGDIGDTVAVPAVEPADPAPAHR
jgi:hypothetical protein